MTPEEAQATLVDKVYVPAFVEKCASNGVQFGSEDELLTALNATARLKTSPATQSQGAGIIHEAARALDVAENGEKAVKQAEDEAVLAEKQAAAAEGEQDSDVAEAVKALLG